MTKLFRRSRDSRVFAGLCGGLGKYTDTDPILWRLGAVLLFLLTCSGIGWAYLIAWIVVPKEENNATA